MTHVQKTNYANPVVIGTQVGGKGCSMSSLAPLTRTFPAAAPAVKLNKICIEKPWGRTELLPQYATCGGGRIGEIWFPGGGNQRLLPKYLFTSEKLSIQVHPEGRNSVFWSGKTECWYILDAGPNATVGLGLKAEVSPEELRDAALNGSIEGLLDWRPVKRGDFLVVTPGTIHAVGSDITLLEVGQNPGVTYRLYDYGRPRQLHVSEAVAAANAGPAAEHLIQHVDGGDDRILLNWPELAVVYTRSDCLQHRGRWVLPLKGSVRCGDIIAHHGECLFLDPGATVDYADGEMIVAAAN